MQVQAVTSASGAHQPPGGGVVNDDSSNETRRRVLAPEALIAEYTRLRELAAAMVDQAEAGAWEALIEQEQRYLDAVDALSRVRVVPVLSDAQAEQRLALLGEVLELNARVKSRLVQRRDELGELIRQSQRQERASEAYGMQAARHGCDFT